MCNATGLYPADNRRPVTKFSGILQSSGATLVKGAKVLDFGCGDGALVRDLAAEGFDAYGCDFTVAANGPLGPRLRAIDTSNYRVPFEADTFDVVISNQVFEHVQDYSVAVSEIARVLKPTGATLNIFPARFRPLEPHVFVPFATQIQSYWWLRLWAAAGIRNGYQRGLSSKEVALRNERYLKGETHYLSRRRIHDEFSRGFSHVSFCDREFVRHLRKSWLGTVDDLTFGALSRGVSSLHTRAVYAAHPLKSANYQAGDPESLTCL